MSAGNTHFAGAVVASARFDHKGRGPRPESLASAGSLEVRLAATPSEIRRAQRLRYRVFFEEGGASADRGARASRRDLCRFDRVCDHLIVVDRAARGADGAPVIAGVYRLLRQEVAEANFGFSSAAEFDVGPLVARHPGKRFLELGRSCVAKDYRSKRTLELLWRGVWAYARDHRVDVMFGCASLPGADPSAHGATLAFLRGEGEAPPAWRVRARPGAAVEPRLAAPPEPRAAIRALPPLVKGYWRLGAVFSREAVVDARFAVTDVFVVLPVEDIRARYLAHFAPRDEPSPLAA